MLTIRLSRFGKKKQPFYRIVVADARAPIKGKYIEKIGHYNPSSASPEIFIDQEKAEKWLKQGALPSGTVWNILVERGILKEKIITKRKKHKKAKESKEEKPAIIEKKAEAENIKEKSIEQKEDVKEKQSTADNTENHK